METPTPRHDIERLEVAVVQKLHSQRAVIEQAHRVIHIKAIRRGQGYDIQVTTTS